MTYIQILAVVIALVWLAAKFESGKARQGDDASADSSIENEESAAPAPKMTPKLHIEGTERFTPKFGYGFLKAFSLPLDHVHDVVRVTGPKLLNELPSKLRDALQRMQPQGYLHGIEVMQFITKGEPLKQEEALYFALVHFPNHEPYVVGFIDKSAR